MMVPWIWWTDVVERPGEARQDNRGWRSAHAGSTWIWRGWPDLERAALALAGARPAGHDLYHDMAPAISTAATGRRKTAAQPRPVARTAMWRPETRALQDLQGGDMHTRQSVLSSAGFNSASNTFYLRQLVLDSDDLGFLHSIKAISPNHYLLPPLW
ncbi:hypothetical protein GUJ93_ZPchr0007g3730 [Zizania palustris]|uniref:Uncharacterized protein n=1 Tax=Zizania palustris TaxID=103762 RepID=A0A8J5T4A1_ZIZPA|nr:hypothetical protein GUJ93_ZPchr0007g3730 [Zizania palustris]